MQRPIVAILARHSLALLALGAVAATALGGSLAFATWRAQRDHRRSAERAMQGHADAAARAYGQHVVSATYLAVEELFEPLGPPNGRQTEAPLAALERAAAERVRCACGPFVRPSYVFAWTAASDTLVIRGASLNAAHRRWLTHEAKLMIDRPERQRPSFVTVADSVPRTSEVLYLARVGSGARVRAVYGIAVTLASLRATLLEPLLHARGLLPIPDSLAKAGATLLTAAVLDADGRELLPISAQRFPRTFHARIEAPRALGRQAIGVTLDPVRAAELLVGGLPPVHAGIIVGMGLLLAALIAGTVAAALRAAALAQARSELIAGVSHELRTPLAQILLFGESLQHDRMQRRHEVHHAADVIVGESRRLIQLVENILLLGRRARMPDRAASQPLPLAPVVRDVVAGLTPLAAPLDTRIVIDQLDAVTVWVPRDAMRQLLINLLDNALKYGPPGQVITVALVRRGQTAQLSLEDEGPGIPAFERERVLQPFVRLGRELEERVGGSGIGLAIVAQIAEEHGGTVRIGAAPAGGARVVVELPQAQPTPPDAVALLR